MHSWDVGEPGFEPASVCLDLVPSSKQVINRSADTMDLCFPALVALFWGFREAKDSGGQMVKCRNQAECSARLFSEYICVLFQTPHFRTSYAITQTLVLAPAPLRLALVLGQMAFPLGSQFPDQYNGDNQNSYLTASFGH